MQGHPIIASAAQPIWRAGSGLPSPPRPACGAAGGERAGRPGLHAPLPPPVSLPPSPLPPLPLSPPLPSSRRLPSPLLIITITITIGECGFALPAAASSCRPPVPTDNMA